MKKKNAGENRNICAFDIMNNVDIISFFDADDFMHPRRLESINNAFEKNNCDIFLHNFLSCNHKRSNADLISDVSKIKITNSISKKYIFHGIWTCMIDDAGNQIMTANGHISVRSSIFSFHRVPENMVGCEDSIFTTTLAKSGYIINATADKLSLYCHVGR